MVASDRPSGLQDLFAPAVFLDRDGVLNRAIIRQGRPYPPTFEEFEVLPGVVEACDVLKRAGLKLLVVTNQPDIARGKVASSDVDRINQALRERLPLDDIAICPHDDADRCACRKPRPGLLLEAAKRHNVDLSLSVMVGDRWRDIAAGQAAGCRTVFIDCRYDEQQPDGPDHVASSLLASVEFILAVQSVEGLPDVAQ